MTPISGDFVFFLSNIYIYIFWGIPHKHGKMIPQFPVSFVSEAKRSIARSTRSIAEAIGFKKWVVREYEKGTGCTCTNGYIILMVIYNG